MRAILVLFDASEPIPKLFYAVIEVMALRLNQVFWAP
jgi:hypothetical protein